MNTQNIRSDLPVAVREALVVAIDDMMRQICVRSNRSLRKPNVRQQWFEIIQKVEAIATFLGLDLTAPHDLALEGR